MRKSMFFGLAALMAALVLLTQATGQTPSKETVINIEDYDCPVCAKDVEKAVMALDGVEDVKSDVEKQTATVTPKSDKMPSPKAIWEAVEKAGFHPTKMVSPSGTFTKKPEV